MKTIIAAGTLLIASASTALAGPFVNIESESTSTGRDYSGTTIRNDVGYETKLGRAKVSIQGGPALVMPDNDALTTELSAKAKIELPVTRKLGVYGVVKAITTDQMNLGEPIKTSVKVGTTYRF